MTDGASPAPHADPTTHARAGLGVDPGNPEVSAAAVECMLTGATIAVRALPSSETRRPGLWRDSHTTSPRRPAGHLPPRPRQLMLRNDAYVARAGECIPPGPVADRQTGSVPAQAESAAAPVVTSADSVCHAPVGVPAGQHTRFTQSPRVRETLEGIGHSVDVVAQPVVDLTPQRVRGLAGEDTAVGGVHHLVEGRRDGPCLRTDRGQVRDQLTDLDRVSGVGSPWRPTTFQSLGRGKRGSDPSPYEEERLRFPRCAGVAD